MSTELTACPYCGNKSIITTDIINPYQKIECETCGVFITNTSSPMCSDQRDKVASYLYYQTIQRTETDRIGILLSDEEAPSKNGDSSNKRYYSVRKEEIDAFYPKSFSERIDAILLLLAKRSDYLGDYIQFTQGQLLSAFFIKRYYSNGEEMTSSEIKRQEEAILDYLHDDNEYVDYGMRDGKPTFELLTEGWKRADELQKKDSKDSKNVFIAMSFASSMTKTREAIKEAITACGYVPRVMDEIEHNHQIVPEMLYEIRQARFVIADLTGHNNGAYYEAGYALGFGKEVIQLCSKEAFAEDGHFDVRQINTIQWETEDDLKEKLIKRIRATIE